MAALAKEAGRQWRIAVRVVITATILAGVVMWVEPQTVLTRLAALDPFWFAVALILSLPQYFLSALRWQLTAARLDVRISFATALSEYYLAVLGNQVFPGGVVGDAARAYRHGQTLVDAHDGRGYGPAVRAVVYERLSGQAMLALLMFPALIAWPYLYGAGVPARAVAGTTAIFIASAAAALISLYWGPFSATPAAQTARGYLCEARHALIAPDVILPQGVYSFGVLLTYLATFYCVGRAVGLEMSMLQVMTLVPVVLFSMAVPFTIGGWGVREATAGTVWGLAGLPESDGVAASVAYGLSVLVSAFPGVVIFLSGLRKNNIGDQR